MFIILEILLLAVFVFAEEEDNSLSPGNVKKVLCEEDYAEISELAMECFETVDHSFYQDTKDCFSDVEGETTEDLKNYYCSHEVEQLEREEECATKWLEENDRGEDIMKMKKEIALCVIDKMNSEEKRK
ncbi:hypothetical protein AVEN_48681-1 [Araneus ventricosus]|uniref:DUF19 domain-containing protein n=1 Tax=Araneus ventricosus TaxID=182803 RepID=A0A4Y2G0E7_ARAVE|nr:hypothetical protein AVEN_48681-1 [Araneus ventricosus]